LVKHSSNHTQNVLFVHQQLYLPVFGGIPNEREQATTNKSTTVLTSFSISAPGKHIPLLIVGGTFALVSIPYTLLQNKFTSMCCTIHYENFISAWIIIVISDDRILIGVRSSDLMLPENAHLRVCWLSLAP